MDQGKARRSQQMTETGGSRVAEPGRYQRGGGPPRRRRGLFVLCVVLVVGLAGAVLAGRNVGRTTAASPDVGVSAPARPPASVTAGTPTYTATHKPSAAAGPGPQKASGVFTTATTSGARVGTGRLRRYKVQVEQGAGVSADSAAREIEGILADPRGWTADRHDAFQLVSGGAFDFEVKIASPATVDAICGAAGLHTRGEVNCDVGDQVVVNLKRWNTGSPEFPGPVREYRALIINHEVGHRIGHGHEGCPGPGRPAPAMMQQIDGLKGCVANAWPYDAQGRYLGGPHVP
jgi:hypothetical protein